MSELPTNGNGIIRDEKGKFKKGSVSPGGFQNHPEHRHNGAWNKEDSPRYHIECMLSMDKKELKKVLDGEHELFKSEFDRGIANNIILLKTATDVDEARTSMETLIKTMESVYGKMPAVVATTELDNEAEEEVNAVIKGVLIV